MRKGKKYLMRKTHNMCFSKKKKHATNIEGNVFSIKSIRERIIFEHKNRRPYNLLEKITKIRTLQILFTLS